MEMLELQNVKESFKSCLIFCMKNEKRHFQQYFSYIMATNFSGGGSGVPERITDRVQATVKLYHLRLRVECTLFVMYKTGCECIV